MHTRPKIKMLEYQYEHFMDHDPRGPMNWGIAVDDGWYEILKDLFEDLTEIGYTGKIFQIKEKFGQLRIYADTSRFAEELLFDNAMRISLKMCERCGTKHIDYNKNDGWLGYNKPFGREGANIRFGTYDLDKTQNPDVNYLRTEGRMWIKTLCSYCHLTDLWSKDMKS